MLILEMRAGDGGGLWAAEGVPGLSQCRRRPQRRHHGHWVEGKLAPASAAAAACDGGRAPLGEGAGAEGGGGQALRRGTF